MLSNQNLIQYIDDFLRIYASRPIKTNLGGMGINHSFALYSVLRAIEPKLVVESGVWKGQSTYIIEKAVPNAQIISLDPNLQRRVYRSKNAKYFSEDFVGIDWMQFDISNSLCFFDDHQNAYNRLMEMKWWGFTKAIFEDNFPVGEGDCYSLRHVFNEIGHINIQRSQNCVPKGRRRILRKIEEWVLKKYYWRQSMIRRANRVDKIGLNQNLKNYFEISPLVLNEKNNWGGSWSNNYAPSTKPLYKNWQDNELLNKLLSPLEPRNLQNELTYGYICFAEI